MNIIYKLVEIFNELRNDSSRTGKEAILEKYKDNKEFREVLRFVYNPYIVTGISTKKMNKKLADIDEKVKEYGLHEPDSVDGLLEYIKTNSSGRDVDIYVVQKCIERVQTKEEEKILLKKIITKTLKVGITAKTINKVYGKDEIPEFSVMLAESYDKKHGKVQGEFYLTKKVDGNRCVAINDANGVKFFTRTGQQIEGMKELEEDLKRLPRGQVFDGELLLKNDDNLSSDDLFRATQKVVRKDGDKKGLEFHIFDSLSIVEFKSGESVVTYENRRMYLEALFKKVDTKLAKVLPIIYKGSDKELVASYMKEAEDNGWEGLMLNTSDGLYKNKRTNDLLKIKKFKTADLLCVGVEEGTGRNEGRLGRINVEYKDNVVGIGSGFSDEQRNYYWNNPNEILNTVIETKFFEESTDEKTGKPSLRFPIFVDVRDDKEIEDINID